MGFFDTLGSVAKGTVEGMVEKANEMKDIKQKFDKYSDDKLAEICEDDSYFGGSSHTEKNIARKILQDRGYPI